MQRTRIIAIALNWCLLAVTQVDRRQMIQVPARVPPRSANADPTLNIAQAATRQALLTDDDEEQTIWRTGKTH